MVTSAAADDGCWALVAGNSVTLLSSNAIVDCLPGSLGAAFTAPNVPSTDLTFSDSCSDPNQPAATAAFLDSRGEVTNVFAQLLTAKINLALDACGVNPARGTNSASCPPLADLVFTNFDPACDGYSIGCIVQVLWHSGTHAWSAPSSY
jgi:hypothetical protein